MKYFILICLLLTFSQAAKIKVETEQDTTDALAADIADIDWISPQTLVEKELRAQLYRYTLWDFYDYIKKIFANFDFDNNGCLS